MIDRFDLLGSVLTTITRQGITWRASCAGMADCWL